MPTRKSRPQKRRRRSIIAFEMIRLDRTSSEPLHEQLYRQVRDELKSGRFSDSSSRLPSSRALAADRGISRSTVRLALLKPHAEGYLRSKPGSGTFTANQFNELPGDRFTLQIPEAGLNIVAWLKREKEFAAVRRITLEIGVRPSPLSFFCNQVKLKPAFVFGFVGLDTDTD